MTADYEIRVGDCLESLRAMPAESVQTCVTSPPYFGLRSYLADDHPDKALEIGLEQTPDAYVAGLVAVFREVRRVLRADGTLWLNIGDSYARSPTKGGSGPGGKNIDYSGSYTAAARRRSGGTGVGQRGEQPKRRAWGDGAKEKDLIGIPWLLAFALRADGWHLRQEIIWNKPNPMPESVKDRCTKAHESLFLLTKSPVYFFDADAIKEPSTYAQCGRPSRKKGDFQAKGEPMPGQLPFRAVTETRNRRSVWTIPTRAYKGAHFATFPPALVEPCILAGSQPGDLVLDPFAGSGTTAGVAVKHGRRAILCELDRDAAALVHDRVEAIAAQKVRRKPAKRPPRPVVIGVDLFGEVLA